MDQNYTFRFIIIVRPGSPIYKAVMFILTPYSFRVVESAFALLFRFIIIVRPGSPIYKAVMFILTPYSFRVVESAFALLCHAL